MVLASGVGYKHEVQNVLGVSEMFFVWVRLWLTEDPNLSGSVLETLVTRYPIGLAHQCRHVARHSAILMVSQLASFSWIRDIIFDKSTPRLAVNPTCSTEDHQSNPPRVDSYPRSSRWRQASVASLQTIGKPMGCRRGQSIIYLRTHVLCQDVETARVRWRRYWSCGGDRRDRHNWGEWNDLVGRRRDGTEVVREIRIEVVEGKEE